MKKWILLFLLCFFTACLVMGCADVAKDNRQTVEYDIAVAKTAAPTEEGYYIVEGTFCELEKGNLLLETPDGTALNFKLSPETVIYKGAGEIIEPGQSIRIVFDGNVSGDTMTEVSVIMVSCVDM